MKQENEDFLVNKFPLLYAGYHLSPAQSCIGRGFEVGDGWFTLIHGLSVAIQSYVDWNNKQIVEAKEWNAMVATGGRPTWWGDRPDAPTKIKVPRKVKQPSVVQVKEKFGTLRFYMNSSDNTIQNFIRVAEATSSVTCEQCGAPGEIRSGGWVRVLCDSCLEQNKQRSNNEN